MSWVAVAITVGTIGSAYISSQASKKASQTQASAAQAAGDTEMYMYEQGRADVAPWRAAGEAALNTLAQKIGQGPGEYTKSPYYDFLMGQGTQAIERGASARGQLLSGGEQKALASYGQGLASQDYDQWLNRWYQSLTPYQSMAGLGLTTAQGNQQAGLQTGANVANTQMAAGQARAAGQLGQANAYSNALNNIANMGMYYGGQGYSPYGQQNYLNQGYRVPSVQRSVYYQG